MDNERFKIIGFYVLLGVVFLVVLMMFLPFLKLLAMAAILAVLFMPIHRRIVTRFKSETWGSVVSLILLILIIGIPLVIIGQMLFTELFNALSSLKESGSTFDKATFYQYVPDKIKPLVEGLTRDLGQKISSFAGNAVAGFTNILSNLAGFVLSIFLVFFSTYYLMLDGKRIKKYFNDIFPLSEEHENRLITRLEAAVNGVVKGQFLVALIQGSVATCGFLIFNVPNPFLWGMLTVLAALVPNVGTSLSLIPAILYLFISGQTGNAIGLAIWGVLAVGMIDNIVSPRLVGSRMQLHPLLVLLSVVGGLQLFGIIGFLLGPIIMAMFVALLEIYRTDLKKYLGK